MEILEEINDIGDGLSICPSFNRNKINIGKIVTGDNSSYVCLDNSDNRMIETKSSKTRFEPIIPYKSVSRWIAYVTGRSGCGKSLIASQLSIQYKMLNKKNNVYYICATSAEDDQNFGELDFVKSLDPSKFYSADMPQEEEREMIKKLLSNSLVIFDDLDMAPPDQKKIITRLQFKLVEIGRKYNISLCIISHLTTNGHHTKMLVNEVDLYFCFKDGLKCNRMLTHYNNFTPDELSRIKTRSWCCFNFKYNAILTPMQIMIRN